MEKKPYLVVQKSVDMFDLTDRVRYMNQRQLNMAIQKGGVLQYQTPDGKVISPGNSAKGSSEKFGK
jgi:hypothetical protein